MGAGTTERNPGRKSTNCEGQHRIIVQAPRLLGQPGLRKRAVNILARRLRRVEAETGEAINTTDEPVIRVGQYHAYGKAAAGRIDQLIDHGHRRGKHLVERLLGINFNLHAFLDQAEVFGWRDQLDLEWIHLGELHDSAIADGFTHHGVTIDNNAVNRTFDRLQCELRLCEIEVELRNLPFFVCL